MPSNEHFSKPANPFIRHISDEELSAYALVPLAERIRRIEHWAHIYFDSTTREERIAHYRLKEGENVKYYDTYGWPEYF